MELKDTIDMMISEDYKERFKAEYHQTKIRYEKLHRMCIKYEAGVLIFQPDCSLELLKQQKAAMGHYLQYLEIRAELEHIDLQDVVTMRTCTCGGEEGPGQQAEPVEVDTEACEGLADDAKGGRTYNLTYADAIVAMTKGKAARRSAWKSGKYCWLRSKTTLMCQEHEKRSIWDGTKMVNYSVRAVCSDWTPSLEDMQAEDWYIID